jgi:ParB family transcriptional regulator, chromosome partitioning protein
MQVEFHQLVRRGEHLRVQHPERQRQLLASLATSGQQTPIVVVAVANQPDRYLVIDGYKRIAALEQLGRDTVEAVIWPVSEAEALVLDRSLRWSRSESALEQGWLLAELEQRFGYGVQELARQFDRSVSWVARRLALVDLLPESVQQQVRTGAISAQVAMKYLVPVARANLEDCRAMAAAFARHKFTCRQAGQLYAAWRAATPKIRQRILQQPELFLKVQSPAETPSAHSAIHEVLRDLEMIVAHAQRAQRRLKNAPTTGEQMTQEQCEQVQRHLDRALEELGRLAARIPREAKREEPPEEESAYVESKSTHHHSGTVCARGEEARDRTGIGGLPLQCAQSPAFAVGAGAAAGAGGESPTLPARDLGVVAPVQEEPGSSA